VSDRPLQIDLNSPVLLRDVPALLQKVMWWWVGEMSELLPGFSKRVLPKAPESATLLVGDGQWQIIGAGRSTDTITIDCSQDDRGVVDQVLHAAPNFALSQMVVVLPAEQVLRRRVDLPIMPEQQLLSALELQVDRLTPFKPENVRLAVKVVARDAVDGKLTADCAFTPRAPVDALEERLARIGFKAARIDVAGEDGEPAGFDLRVHEAMAQGPRPFVMRVALSVAAIACWYLAGVLWDVSRQQELAAWQSRIDELRPAANATLAMRQRLEALTEPFEIARTHQPAELLAPLKDMTHVIPDSARLTEFEYSGTSVTIAGLAADASSLITALEKSPRFKDVKFRSQVMRRPESNKERFEISLTLEGRTP
jgi:general secretion pathway protein L